MGINLIRTGDDCSEIMKEDNACRPHVLLSDTSQAGDSL